MKRAGKIVGVTLLCMSCFSGGLMADSVVKEIKATQRKDIEVTKSYQKQVLKDGNGNLIYPIMYNNNIYLPIRALSTLANADISWDNTNKRVNVEPKVNVQYIQIPVKVPETTTTTQITYSNLTTADKKKVDTYNSQIDDLEIKITRYEDKLVLLDDKEEDALDLYNKTSSREDRDKLDSIRDDISYYEDLISTYKRDVKALNTKIDAIYESYKK